MFSAVPAKWKGVVALAAIVLTVLVLARGALPNKAISSSNSAPLLPLRANAIHPRDDNQQLAALLCPPVDNGQDTHCFYQPLVISAPLPTASPSPVPTVTARPQRTWQELGSGSASDGGISSNAAESGWPAVAVSRDGTVYAAWTDQSDGDRQIYVKMWQDGRWQPVGAGSVSGGGISRTSGESVWPAIAMGLDGKPFVAWRDWSSGRSQIYVLRWSGARWMEVGANSASAGGVSRTNATSEGGPAIAIDGHGHPIIAWEDNSFGWDQIYIKRWNGNSWSSMGRYSDAFLGVSGTLENSRRPHLAVAPDGKVYVTWADSISGNAEVFVRRWNGTGWAEVGANSARVGGISQTPGDSQTPWIAVGADGIPYVTWTDNNAGDYEVYVRRWNGTAWPEVGSGSATGGGISGNSGDSLKSRLAIGPDGTSYVMWYDDSAGDAEVYVRYWNGSSWVEAGAGSASGGGISSNGGTSAVGSLAVAPNGDPYVAWGDNSSGNYEVYVKRWTE